MSTAIRRTLPLLALAAFLAALVAAPAQAKVVRLTGETTALTLNATATGALSANSIVAAPLAPATADGATFTFPITGGRVGTKNLYGVVLHRGGIKFTKDGKTAVLRRFVIVNRPKGTYLDGLVLVRTRVVHRAAGRARVRFVQVYRAARLLKLSNLARADANGKVVVTADAALTPAAAKYLNRRLGVTVFTDGVTVGTAKVTATVAS